MFKGGVTNDDVSDDGRVPIEGCVSKGKEKKGRKEKKRRTYLFLTLN